MIQYIVTGMSCAACSARVEKAVSKVPLGTCLKTVFVRRKFRFVYVITEDRSEVWGKQ